jgi:hypothetical protein
MIAPRRGHSPQPNGIHARIERVAGPVGIARESSKKFRGIPFQLFQLTYWGAQVSKKALPLSRGAVAAPKSNVEPKDSAFRGQIRALDSA